MTVNSLIAAEVLQDLRRKRMRAEDVLRPGLPKKKIAVVGDQLEDVYIHGSLEDCQDGCPKFTENYPEWKKVEGGAANACMSLSHSAAKGHLFCDPERKQRKKRFIVDGKIVFRQDGYPPIDRPGSQWPRRVPVENLRDDALKHLGQFDAVYVADYDKGFVTDEFMQQIVAECQRLGIVCVVDPKRDPECCRGAVLKCNEEFALKWKVIQHSPGFVVTHAADHPTVSDDNGVNLIVGDCLWNKVSCVSHVGAGDCFGAWLTLGLAHGLKLQEAARLAHAAGRVYVQHPHNRPPWPHEIRKELDPVGGKLITPEMLGNIRASTAGRVVFANGCFRVPHAGHSWFLHKAKEQGDVLVVGVNSNISAFRCKPGEFCLPVEQRVQLLAAQQSVDWVVVFEEDTPISLIEALRPDVIAKGGEYRGKEVPGDTLCEVWFAPEGPFRQHSGDVIRSIRG